MKNSNLLQKYLVDIVVIVTGTIGMAAAYYLLLKPNDIMAPGLGGIAIILAEFLPLNLGGIYFVLNIPLFLIGYRYVGWKFVIYSLCGMLSLSLFLFLFEILQGYNQPLIGGIFGGILNGAFLALILRVGGSTGGLDIAFIVINKLWPKFTVGRIMIGINIIVVIASGIIFSFSSLLYTIISIYLAGKTLDFILLYKKNQSESENENVSISNK